MLAKQFLDIFSCDNRSSQKLAIQEFRPMLRKAAPSMPAAVRVECSEETTEDVHLDWRAGSRWVRS